MIWEMRRAFQFLGERSQQLPNPGGLDRKRGSHKTQTRRVQAKNCLRTKGSHHLVVAHVYEPQVTLTSGTLTRDRQDGIRINCCDCHANHFEVSSRETLAQ